MVQDQSEKVANTLIEQANWLPEEGRQVIGQWSEMYKKGRNDLKSAVDENYGRLAEMLSTGR
jgi:hypothetical protein